MISMNNQISPPLPVSGFPGSGLSLLHLHLLHLLLVHVLLLLLVPRCSSHYKLTHNSQPTTHVPTPPHPVTCPVLHPRPAPPRPAPPTHAPRGDDPREGPCCPLFSGPFFAERIFITLPFFVFFRANLPNLTFPLFLMLYLLFFLSFQGM